MWKVSGSKSWSRIIALNTDVNAMLSSHQWDSIQFSSVFKVALPLWQHVVEDEVYARYCGSHIYASPPAAIHRLDNFTAFADST